MTLARYQGTGLAEVTAPAGMARTPRWWRQLSCSRYCPRCLAANGGRWMLTWRIPWAFACTSCQVLLADTCPDCCRRHRRTRTGQPRQPGHCDLTGLPLPPPRPPGATTFSCASDLAGTPAVALPAGGHVLAAQQHTDAIISALLASRGRPAEAAALRQQLDGHLRSRPRRRLRRQRPGRPPARSRRGPGRARRAAMRPRTARTSRHAARPGGPLPPAARARGAFGTDVADIMLHGRADDPDPEIAAWLAANGAVRRSQPGPGDMLADWNRASPALQAALARPLASRLDTFRQLRYRAVGGPARIPRPDQASDLAAVLPALIWPGWALRLMPPRASTSCPTRPASP
jgi:hypothetical protein